MKKLPALLYAIAFLVLCAIELSAQEQISFNAPFKTHSFEANVNVNNGTGVELFRASESFAYYYRGRLVTGIAGIQFSELTTDLVLHGTWYPLQFSKFKAGFGALYHFGRYTNIEFEHDFFIGIDIVYCPSKYFYLGSDVSGTLKITEIPSLPREFSSIRDEGLAVSFKMGSVIAQKFRVELSIASYELFRYHLFLHPTFSASLNYVFENGFYAGAVVGARYSDIFTLTSHVDNLFGVFVLGLTL